MSAIVGLKLSMNCGETNVDKTMNAKKDTKLDAKRDVNIEKTWVQ